MKNTATFSPCRKYRYTLWRCWKNLFSQDSEYIMFIGLNPSTADEIINDNTIRRCIGYAKDWGYTGLCMMNIFAFRATQPKNMRMVEDPIGPDNDRELINMAKLCNMVVAAWGNDGKYMNRGKQVRAMIPDLHYLRLTAGGFPAHPLYLPKKLKPILWKNNH